MLKYAVVQQDGIVLNTIVANTKQYAEEVTGMLCIEYTDEPVEPGSTWDGVSFIKKKPYPSWILSEDKEWKAPIQKPENTETEYYLWDEDSLSWLAKNK